jgi:tRNA G18 (ribose-2'-O)-methylase SpoU
MSKTKVKTSPNLADTSPAHQKAIADGTEHFSSWQYNVADHFKDKTVEEIKQTLKDNALPFAVCMENILGDFNLGTVARNCNAFGAQAMYYIGNKKVDRRSMIGVYNYTDIIWLPTVDDFVKLKEKFHVVAVDNISGAVPISTYNFVPNTLFVFGEEGTGLTPAMQDMCQDMIYIEQFGSVRSLNVGTASGIIMHEFVSRYKKVSK